MDAYIFQAALQCEPCAMETRSTLTALHNYGPDDWPLDSGDWPQGPYPNGGGESDGPEHCDRCGLFLENPLTSDGEAHVKEELEFADGDPEVLKVWAEFYDYIMA